MENNKNAFYKAQEKVTLKKEEIFKAQNLSKMEIPSDEYNKIDKNRLVKDKDYAFSKMLPKESNHLLGLKQNYGFYNSMLFFEYDRIRVLNSTKHKDQFIKVSEKHTDILTDVIHF